MFCVKCGETMNDNARFCTKCGAVNEYTPPVQPAAQPLVQPIYQQQYAPQPMAPAIKKRHLGRIIIPIIVLIVLAGAGYLIYQTFWGPPRDLGIRYTQADFTSAMQKVGLKVNFLGKSDDELTELIAANRDKRLPVSDYNWSFANFQERSFQLTPSEATAFINEIAPPFSWFEDAQMKTFPDGSSAGSYKVRFDKIKEELIPDLVDQIPAAISAVLPDTFNLYMEGSFEIIENEVSVPDKLDKLEVGGVPMQPLIGDITEEARATVFDYAERLYKEVVPGLIIHKLKINSDGNFDISVYMPTEVTATAK